MVKQKDKDIMYHYLVFDLCNIDVDSTLEIYIQARAGSYKGYISARIDKVEKFNIVCPSNKIDIFYPRKDFGSC